MKISTFILTAALGIAQVLSAGEPAAVVPEKPIAPAGPSTWRPYKDFPDVLYYQGFEHAAPEFTNGKIVTDDPAPPGGHVWKLETSQWASSGHLHFDKTKVKIPQGFVMSNITIQASFYADGSGGIFIKAFPEKGGEYSHEVVIPKPKTWNTVTFKFTDMRNKDTHPEADHVLKELEFGLKAARGKKEIPKGYVDDIIITIGGNATELKTRILTAEKHRIDMEKQLDRDGFTFTIALNEFLKNAVKPFKSRIKAKSVMVMGPSPDQTSVWKEQLKTATSKFKDVAFTFDGADEPGPSDKPVGGLTDMRTLLLYNLQKAPEFVILAVSPEDAIGPGRPSEVVRIAVLRALEAGTVPIVCLPAPTKLEEKEKVAAFAKVMEGMCAQLGVPLVDGGKATKNEKGEFDAAKVGAPAAEKGFQLVVTVMKLVHESMNDKP